MKEQTNFEPIYRYYVNFLKQLILFETLEVLPTDHDIILSSIELSWKYNLLPNDALIAAACKHYEINKIATLDSDFKRAKFLQIVDV